MIYQISTNQISAQLSTRRFPRHPNSPHLLDLPAGDWALKGEESGLHVIILDELDAICRKRGSLSGDTSGIRDSVVNQLLAKVRTNHTGLG